MAMTIRKLLMRTYGKVSSRPHFVQCPVSREWFGIALYDSDWTHYTKPGGFKYLLLTVYDEAGKERLRSVGIFVTVEVAMWLKDLGVVLARSAPSPAGTRRHIKAPNTLAMKDIVVANVAAKERGELV